MSENHVQAALKNIREKKKITTVTIAHRLTTILESDSIAVINEGSIAELGDHLTLLNKEGGIYQSLCKTQGITPTNPCITNGDYQTAPSEDRSGTKADLNGTCTHSEKAVTDVAALEAGQKDDVNGTEEGKDDELVPMARMSKILQFLGRDTLYALMGVVGSAGVGALSPCESILTAQIVT